MVYLPRLGTTTSSLNIKQGDSWVNPAIGLGLNGFSGQAMTTLSLTYLADCYNEVNTLIF
jgi:hypothetical protein